MLSLLYGSTLTSVHDYWKTIALTTQPFVSRVMSLLLNMLSRFVIAFLPRSKHLLISQLQPPSSVILEPKKIKFATVSTFFPSICHEVMGPDAMILVFFFFFYYASVYLFFSFKTVQKVEQIQFWFLLFAVNIKVDPGDSMDSSCMGPPFIFNKYILQYYTTHGWLNHRNGGPTVKLYTHFLLHRGLVPLKLALFKGQLYIIIIFST